MFTQKKSLIFVAVFCSLILIFQISFSGVPKDMVAETEKETDSIEVLQDSLFAQINRSFQTVMPILEYSCYDCHSVTTNEPWYFNIPGVNSFLTSHIDEAREHLDFTDGFPFKSKDPLLEILHELKEEVEEGEMPLFSYRIMHWGHLIENEKQDSLFLWISETETALKQFYEAHNIKIDSEESEESEH